MGHGGWGKGASQNLRPWSDDDPRFLQAPGTAKHDWMGHAEGERLVDAMFPSVSSLGWPGGPCCEGQLHARREPPSKPQLDKETQEIEGQMFLYWARLGLVRPRRKAQTRASCPCTVPLPPCRFKGLSDARYTTSWSVDFAPPVFSNTRPLDNALIGCASLRTTFDLGLIQIVEDPPGSCQQIPLFEMPRVPSARCVHPRTGGSPCLPMLGIVGQHSRQECSGSFPLTTRNLQAGGAGRGGNDEGLGD